MRPWQWWALAVLVLGGGLVFMRRITQTGVDLIKREEGLRLVPYQDAAGRWTIGYGHLIKPGESFTRITPAQAEAILRWDVADAEHAVAQAVKVPLSDAQFNALVSLVYNIGAGAFGRSTVLRKLNAGDYAGAADAILAWKYAGGKPILAARRERERALFVSAPVVVA